MNEQKKSYHDFVNNVASEQKINANELVARIGCFISHNKMKPADWILLTKMIKQLNNPNFNAPRKVLRSMQTKFETIQNKYQR